MGFIEELRRQKEAERLASKNAEKQARLATQERAVEQELMQRDHLAAEQEQIAQVRLGLEQARLHLLESSFPSFLNDLAGVLPKPVVSTIEPVDLLGWKSEEVSDGRKMYGRVDFKNAFDLSGKITQERAEAYFRYRVKEGSPVGLGIMLTWYEGKIEGLNEGSFHSWNEKFGIIPIVCSSEGQITLGVRQITTGFHSSLIKDVRLPLNAWINNPTVQEEKLGFAYGNHRFLLECHAEGGPGLIDPHPGLGM